MADQQRYSEEEVHSILREAIRLPSVNSESGFTREDIQRFAADAGINDESLQQSLKQHKGRRRARVVELLGTTAITFDWELYPDEVDTVAVLCGAQEPLVFYPGPGYELIAADRLGFSGVVKVLSRDGFTQVELTRQIPLETMTLASLFAVLCPTVGWFATSVVPGIDSDGREIPSSPAWIALWLMVLGLILVVGTAILKSRNSTRFRTKAVDEILDELGAKRVKRGDQV
ncbi:MAG: hypothetical protein QE269_09380 [Fimbriimonas sp.]|nr:hypothetical protein [Fimbriimonas sp.]